MKASTTSGANAAATSRRGTGLVIRWRWGISCSCLAEAGADTEQSRPWPTMTVGWVERSETHHLPAITRRGVMGFASLYSSYAGRIQNSRSSHSVRSEEHTSELQSQMRNSYAVFCLNKK